MLEAWFGDGSDSHSEKYELRFEPLVGGGQTVVRRNEAYGRCETTKVFLRPDAVYRLTMRHLASNRDGAPDRDYTLTLTAPEGVLIVDEAGLQGTYTVADGEPFPGAGKAVLVYAFDAALVPDYDRDGAFSDADAARAVQGETLHVWANDDREIDAQNGVESVRGGGCDFVDDCVNGKSDVEDFFPVAVRLGESVRYYLAQHPEAKLALRTPSESLNCVWAFGATPSSFYTLTEGGYGVDGKAKAEAAPTSELVAGGVPFPDILRERLAQTKETAHFLVEGRVPGTEQGLELMLQESSWTTPLARCSVQVSNVRDFYSVLDLREQTSGPTLTEIAPAPDLRGTVLFVHGYRVDRESALDWFDVVFKRLWQAGLNAHFCGVTWAGDDEGWLPNYYQNVENAFVAAERLSRFNEWYERPRTVLAHSLGNMVVSSAIQDHGSHFDAYFMLNSAVPSEAYDADAPAYDFATNSVPAGLVHDDWRAYPAKSWASMWYRHYLPHKNYTPDTLGNALAALTWKGRFRDILSKQNITVYNYYSGEEGATGDEVLEILDRSPEPTEGFDLGGNNKGRYSWQKQELYKGRRKPLIDWLGENILEQIAASDEMGWGFAEELAERPSPDAVENSPPETFAVSPIFLRSPKEILFSGDAATILANRDHLLAYAIPALSKPMGRISLKFTTFFDVQRNFVDDLFKNDWARTNGTFAGRWLHSDIKDLSFPFVRAFWKRVIEEGRLGCKR